MPINVLRKDSGLPVTCSKCGKGSRKGGARNMMIGALLTMAALVVFLAVSLARGLVRQLGGGRAYAAKVASKVAAGNLSMEVVF